MKYLKGFTLVEVLITLAVLGIVVASTIIILPNVIPQEHTFTAKKVSVTLSDGVKTLLDDNKLYPKKNFDDGQKFCKDYVGLFATYKSSDCSTSSDLSSVKLSAGDKIPSNLYSSTNLTTSTGEVWMGLNQKFKDTNTPIKILVDVNGPDKGHNILGEDVVLLSLYSNGKIGEFEGADTSFTQKTPDAIDCNKCTFIPEPIPNTCNAASKGRMKLACKGYSQCDKQGQPYACCAYILNHYWDYPWNPWSKTTRSRTTKDDTGKICTQTCDSLTKSEATKVLSCNSDQKQKNCNTYYLPYSPFSIQGWISKGQEIKECRNNCQEYSCCSYVLSRNRLKDYWGENQASWNKNTRTGSLKVVTGPDGTKDTCTLSCDSLVPVKKENTRKYDDGSPAGYIEEYFLPNADGTPSSKKIAVCEREKDIYKAKFINIYTIGDGGFSDPNCTKFFGKNGTNALYKRLKKCEETCGLKTDSNGIYYEKGAYCCEATFRVNISEFTFYKLNKNNQLQEVTNIDKNKYIITNCSIPDNSWSCPINYGSKDQIGTPGTLNKEYPKGSSSDATCKIVNNGKSLEIFVRAGADLRADGKPKNYDDWAMTGLNIEIKEQ